MQDVCRIGVIGTGFIARGLVMILHRQPDLAVSHVLTRRAPAACGAPFRPELVTNSVYEMIDHSDLCVECSGDPIYGTDVLDKVMAAARPVVTMNAELQVTTGSHFARCGLITEAEGDQPGCLAALRENVIQMGFQPLVYGNIKGFLNHTPTREEMLHWAGQSGISLEQVTAFTDGTKIQIEQALVANGLGAEIAQPGLLGIACEDPRSGAGLLAETAMSLGCPISDYILSPNSPPGVFIVGEHCAEQRGYLKYLRMGEGPHYVLLQNYHLCHLEIVKTIRRVLRGGGVLLNNGEQPTVSVSAVAKRRLQPGQRIRRGIGSFDVRGVAVRIADDPDHLPIGLLANATIMRSIEAGERLSYRDVEIADSLALQVWRELFDKTPRESVPPPILSGAAGLRPGMCVSHPSPQTLANLAGESNRS